METEKSRENEQTPEEILEILKNAAENGLKTQLTVSGSEGKPDITNTITPYCFDGAYITVETENGDAFDLEIIKIKKAELV